MKLQIHSDADQKLLEFIQVKVDKLETFYDRLIDGEVFLKIEKGEHSRENKVVEIKLNLPGDQLFAKEHSTSFEAAVDEACESLRRQVKKHKEKLYAKY